jgi:hypothetical protein
MKHKKVLNNAKEKKIHKTSLSFSPAKMNAPKKEAIKPVANFKLETPSACKKDECSIEYLAKKDFLCVSFLLIDHKTNQFL